MTKISALDHLVIVVSDLDHAIQEFTELGFNVTLGGSNGPTQNALIGFSKNTYIELICVPSRFSKGLLWLLARSGLLFKSSLKRRLFTWFDGQFGFRDWCLKANLNYLYGPQLRPELNMCRTGEFTRTRPDGTEVRWVLNAPTDRNLPFLIADQTEESLRIPQNDLTPHPNGLSSINKLEMSQSRVAAYQEQVGLLHPFLISQDSEIELTASSDGESEILVWLLHDAGHSSRLHIDSNGSPTLRSDQT